MLEKMSNILVLDVGTQSVRGIVFNEKGVQLSNDSRPLHTHEDGIVFEQNPLEWWEGISEVVEEVLSDKQIRYDVKVIAATATSYGVVGVDSQGNPTTKALMHLDKRAVKQAGELAAKAEFREVARATGLKAEAMYILPKVMWVKANEPDVFSKTHVFLDSTAFVNFMLTGKIFTDTWNALKNYASPETGELSEKLLKAVGIKPSKFPKAFPPGTKSFPLKDEVRREFSLPRGVNAVLTTYDAGLAVISSGARKPGDVHEQAGTMSAVKVLTACRVDDRLNRVYPMPPLESGCWYIGGYTNSAGGVFEWYKNNFFRGITDPYAKMNAEAESSPPGANELLFLPYIFGEKSPIWDPNARGVLFGLKASHSKEDITRAMYESLGYSVRHIIETIEELGVKTGEVYMSGGLTASDTLSQIKADVYGKKIYVLKEKETTCLGAAILAAVNAGLYPSITDAVRGMVHIGKTFKPNQKAHETYNKTFIQWKQLYVNTKSRS